MIQATTNDDDIDDDDDDVSVTSHDDDDDLDAARERADANEDDDVIIQTGGPKHIACAEDEDFMQAFDKMLSDNVQARSNESVKVPQLDIAVPMHMRSQKPRCEYIHVYSPDHEHAQSLAA